MGDQPFRSNLLLEWGVKALYFASMSLHSIPLGAEPFGASTVLLKRPSDLVTIVTVRALHVAKRRCYEPSSESWLGSKLSRYSPPARLNESGTYFVQQTSGVIFVYPTDRFWQTA